MLICVYTHTHMRNKIQKRYSKNILILTTFSRSLLIIMTKPIFKLFAHAAQASEKPYAYACFSRQEIVNSGGKKNTMALIQV